MPQEPLTPPPPRVVWEDPAVRAILQRRDITELYAVLTRWGLTQRNIAELVGQSQSQVHEILHSNRQVRSYTVLERIAEGLQIPRGHLGLAYDLSSGRELGPGLPAVDEDEEMRRRKLLTHGTAIVLAAQWDEIPPPEQWGRLWPAAPATPPSALEENDVVMMRGLAHTVGGLAKSSGLASEVMIAQARLSDRWFRGAAAATDDLRKRYASALGELFLVAGWAAFDEGKHDGAWNCLARTMELAREGGDEILACRAGYYQGVAVSERPDARATTDGLSWLATVSIKLHGLRDPRAPGLRAWVAADSAALNASCGAAADARAGLAEAADYWSQAQEGPGQYRPSGDDAADMTWLHALVQRQLGQPEVALQNLNAAAAHWARTSDRRQLALWKITSADLHLAEHDPAGLQLAADAIKAARLHRSDRTRRKLAGLGVTLHQYGGPEADELASEACLVAG